MASLDFPSAPSDTFPLFDSSISPAASSAGASSVEASPPVPLPRRRLFLGSFSSTTVTSLPGSFLRTLAEGESSTKPLKTSLSAD